MTDQQKERSLAERLLTWRTLLQQLGCVVSELEDVGFLTIVDREKWERLIIPERVRVGVMMKTLGVSPPYGNPYLDGEKKSSGAPLTANYQRPPGSNGTVQKKFP